MDFVLCDPETLRPVLAIELDDASHRHADRQQRDALLDAAFSAAGLRLVRVPVRTAYDLAGLRELLAFTSTPDVLTPEAVCATSAPACPKCDVPLVERRASRGANAGQTFFGCPSYPRCRHITS